MSWTGAVRGTAAIVILACCVAGCEPGDPCADYVDYMCACHEADTGVDCDALSATYEDAGPAVQNECAVLLDDQEGVDQAAGQTCE
jgi:hypothetical protein